MALVEFPDDLIQEVTISLSTFGGADYTNPVGELVDRIPPSRGHWTGTLTSLFYNNEDDEDSDEASARILHARRSLYAFAVSAIGNEFDLPFFYISEGWRNPPFPTLSESSDANSVHVTGRRPNPSSAPEFGIDSVAILSRSVAPPEGLKKGMPFSLHDSTLDRHFGMYLCRSDQIANEVAVRPSIPPFPDGLSRFRMNTRNPTIRCILTGDNPELVIAGPWLEPLTIQWRSV